jgi:hypothetical protein
VANLSSIGFSGAGAGSGDGAGVGAGAGVGSGSAQPTKMMADSIRATHVMIIIRFTFTSLSWFIKIAVAYFNPLYFYMIHITSSAFLYSRK